MTARLVRAVCKSWGRLAAAMTISTRRFLARPCGVSLGATGRASPKPWAEIEFCGTPLETRKRTTASARADESSRFDGKRAFSSGPIGTLSV